jgi:hypothetical protein
MDTKGSMDSSAVDANHRAMTQGHPGIQIALRFAIETSIGFCRAELGPHKK